MPGHAHIRPFTSGGKAVNVVIETPKGSRAKYKFDVKRGVFELHKALALGYGFPFPFGYIPGTLGEDGDPLDVLLVTTLEPPVGVVLKARLIGVIEVEQRDKGKDVQRNDRLVAVPLVKHEDRPVSKLNALEEDQLRDIELFFVESGARDGKEVRIVGRHGPSHAMRLARSQSLKAFR